MMRLWDVRVVERGTSWIGETCIEHAGDDVKTFSGVSEGQVRVTVKKRTE